MKKIELGQAISILANIGVIAGIVFLGVELRQNNALLTSQAASYQFSIERETRRPFLENTEGFSELFVKVQAGEPLSEIQMARLAFLRVDIFDSWRYQFREVHAGRLPSEFIDIDKWRFWWDTSVGIPEMFQDDRAALDPDFVQFIEDNVINR